MEKCAICGKEIKGFGCNPSPVAEGVCCEKCDKDVVLPLRVFLAGVCKNQLLCVQDNCLIFIENDGEKASLESLQTLVEGYIEFFPLKNDHFVFVVNEEGLLKKMKPNKLAKEIFGIDVVGPLVVCPKELID